MDLFAKLIFLAIASAALSWHTTFAQNSTHCVTGTTHCSWEEWGMWSACSKTCGTGTRTRQRGLCCTLKQTFEQCVTSCSLKDSDSLETETCSFVCPAGNCTYEKLLNTGIEVTDYKTLVGADGKITNAPLHLITPTERFCKISCENVNFNNGYFCWAYTWNNVTKCYLHFYKSPLIVARPELKGSNTGESINIRSCTESVKCQATKADIILVVDSSGSIGTENFDKVRNFLKDLVNSLDVDPSLTRVGLMLFNDKATWQFTLNRFGNKFDMLKVIERMEYIVGGTITHQALATVRQEGFGTARPGVPRIAIVITDGLSRYPAYTRREASLLRDAGVTVYSVGVGDQANYQEIFDMASSPEKDHVVQFASFDDLNPNNLTLAVDYDECKELATTTPATNTATTTPACSDKIPNCADYGLDACTDYKPWASVNCQLYCKFCQAPSNVRPCEDENPSCASYGHYYCEAKEYVRWVDQNCRKYCGLCVSNDTTTTSTTVATTTPHAVCEDKRAGCTNYVDSCKDPIYEGFLRNNCAATCGFCRSYLYVNGTTVHNTKCPDWQVPSECTMSAADHNCCPFPICPSTYVYTVDKGNTYTKH